MIISGLPKATEIPAPAPAIASDRVPDLLDPYTSERAAADVRAMGEGVSSGFTALDAIGFKWRPGKLYAVAARPSEGKTTLLLEFLMRHVEGGQDRFGVYIGYEENRPEAYNRLIRREASHTQQERGKHAAYGHIPGRDRTDAWLRNGRAADDPLTEAARRLDAISDRLAIIDGDRHGGEIDALLTTLRAITGARGTPPTLVVVDYYQKIRPPKGLRGASRQEQLQAVADEVRQYAKGEGHDAVPVIVGAQVNREPAATKERRNPELHEIREADDLANDAAGVLTLYLTGDDDGAVLQAKAVKNRDGRRGGEPFPLFMYGSVNRVTEQRIGQSTGNGPRIIPDDE